MDFLLTNAKKCPSYLRLSEKMFSGKQHDSDIQNVSQYSPFGFVGILHFLGLGSPKFNPSSTTETAPQGYPLTGGSDPLFYFNNSYNPFIL